MSSLGQQPPQALADALRATGARRGWLAPDGRGGVRTSGSLAGLGVAEALGAAGDARDHQAVFLEVGRETACLMGAFVHSTRRGQAQGGLRYWPYASLEAWLRDGLRLARGMGRKCALAGLWWGGGKGVVARRPGRDEDPGRRRAVFADYGRFVSSLRGCYVTAEDAGTTPADLAELQHHTRFVTCIPPERGGSGNPSEMTARGVVAAMETALGSSLDGARIAMQGAGQVGSAMVPMLLERGVSRLVVADTSAERCRALAERFGDPALQLREAEADDDSILAEDCEVLVPNALGAVLGPKTIPGVRARVVCGAANNPLEDDVRDARALQARGITYVPDFVANRMGIVWCANEHAGSLPDDPDVLRHLDPGWQDSVQAVTRRVLDEAERSGTTPVEAANRLADERASEPNPLWGDRATRIVRSLLDGDWADG